MAVGTRFRPALRDFFSFGIVVLLLFTECPATRAQQTADSEALDGENILAAQILANTSAALVTTPLSGQLHLWSGDHGWQEVVNWQTNYSSQTIFLLVKIDEALLEAAVTQWSINMNTDDEEIQAARSDLRERYLRHGVDTFMFFAPPLNIDSESWAFTLPDFQSKITQRSFSGEHFKSVIYDACPDRMMTQRSATFICIIGFLTREMFAEPYYYIETFVRHHIRSRLDQKFIPAAADSIVEFRIEVGEVPLVAMVRRGIDWENIRSTHLDTHVAAVSSLHGADAADFILDLGVSVVSGLLLRGLRLR